MTGHNANDMATRGAAQEAVAYRLEVQTEGVEPFTQYVTDRAFIETLRNAGMKVSTTPLYAAPVIAAPGIDVDALAQEIRRVDGTHSVGAGALAEALVEWLSRHVIDASPKGGSDAQAVLDALVSLVAVARRYLPDYDEHPDVQKADAAIDAAMQATSAEVGS